MTLEELLRRRLVFTVGKGGVGRTTVTVALALEAARRGCRVLLVELEGARGLAAAFAEQREASPPPPGVERLSYLAVDGRLALEEYLSLVIPVRRLLKTIFSSRMYQYFVAAAPGLKELMTIGKIWYEVEKKQEGSPTAPLWDLVLVDAPATGHSLQYLRMPEAALAAFPSGLVHREAQRVVSLLRDSEATAVVVVTLAEEMPANETVEIYTGLREIGLSPAVLVVNQVHQSPCTSDELEPFRTWLASSAAASEPSRAAIVGEIVERAQEEQGWAAINAANIARLERDVPVPVVLLPFLYTEEFGTEHVAKLSEEITRQLDQAAARPRSLPSAGRSRRRPA